MKNIKTIGVITILVAFNLVLLYLNTNLQNRIKNVELQANSWGFEKTGDSVARLIHPQVQLPETGLSLIVLITDEGCITCMENEVRNLNDFHEKFRDRLKVYSFSRDTSYFEQFPVYFTLELIDPDRPVLDNEFDFNNPVALVTDNNGMVQTIQVAEVGKAGKRNEFYKRMTSLFKSVK